MPKRSLPPSPNYRDARALAAAEFDEYRLNEKLTPVVNQVAALCADQAPDNLTAAEFSAYLNYMLSGARRALAETLVEFRALAALEDGYEAWKARGGVA